MARTRRRARRRRRPISCLLYLAHEAPPFSRAAATATRHARRWPAGRRARRALAGDRPAPPTGPLAPVPGTGWTNLSRQSSANACPPAPSGGGQEGGFISRSTGDGKRTATGRRPPPPSPRPCTDSTCCLPAARSPASRLPGARMPVSRTADVTRRWRRIRACVPSSGEACRPMRRSCCIAEATGSPGRSRTASSDACWAAHPRSQSHLLPDARRTAAAAKGSGPDGSSPADGPDGSVRASGPLRAQARRGRAHSPQRRTGPVSRCVKSAFG
jgi:hypothetical protein